MAQCNNLLSLVFGLSLVALSIETQAETQTSSGNTEFTATIIDSDCQWTWNETSLHFSVFNPQQVSPLTALEIKPLTAMIECNMAIAPKLTVSGITPYSGNDHVFLSGSVDNGMGFMLQIDEGDNKTPSLGSFYSEGINGKAITNNIPISVNKVAANKQAQQIIWVGLVGMKNSQDVIPGPFSAVLVVTGIIP